MLSRTVSKSVTSGDHPRGPRRAGDKLILFIHRPTPCTPAGAVPRGNFRRLLQTGIAGIPGPGYSGPASLTPSPPGLALAAGAVAGAVGARGI